MFARGARGLMAVKRTAPIANNSILSASFATGKVKWFDTRKGFGFITQDDDETDIFIHQSEINMEGFRFLDVDQRVTFDHKDTPKGPVASNCVPDEEM